MKQSVAQALLEIGAVGFSPRTPIQFKSGILSPVYVDNRRLPYHPAQWQIIITGFAELIKAQHLAFDVIAGVAVGGVPHSAALAYVLQKPSIFIRKEAKGHGKAQRIEGGDVEGKHVILIEDLITTSSSSLSGVEALREAGAICDTILAIVSYGFEEATRNVEKAEITLHTLTDFATILQEAEQQGRFTKEEATTIRQWFDDPHKWTSNMKMDNHD